VVRRAAGDKAREKDMGRAEGERRHAYVAALTQACRLAVDDRSLPAPLPVLESFFVLSSTGRRAAWPWTIGLVHSLPVLESYFPSARLSYHPHAGVPPGCGREVCLPALLPAIHMQACRLAVDDRSLGLPSCQPVFRLSGCLSVCPSVCPSVRLSVCLSVCPSVGPSYHPLAGVPPGCGREVRLPALLSACVPSVYPSVCLRPIRHCQSYRLAVDERSLSASFPVLRSVVYPSPSVCLSVRRSVCLSETCHPLAGVPPDRGR
jgi:hypothetical protein